MCDCMFDSLECQSEINSECLSADRGPTEKKARAFAPSQGATKKITRGYLQS